MDSGKILQSICTVFALLIAGGISGAASKLLDIYTSNLGNIFSQMSIWILLGTLISIHSRSRLRAAINLFSFCVGMLIAYYITAELTSSVYNMAYVYGWAAFALCAPAFAALVWTTNQRCVLSALISIGIPAATLLISMILFDGPRIYDILIIAVEILVLLRRRSRNSRKKE